jgi:DeoR family transcriptional regulator, fructose operon transcriptional repressor
MLIPMRQSRLQDFLAKRGMCDLDTLAAELNVSQSTVRRDIEQLEQRGLVSRTHGGVIWIGDSSSTITPRPYAFDQRMNYQVESKRQIARAAASLVSPGETVLIDGGTTTYYLAQELLGRSLQLVTNSLPIANLFLNDEHVELILSGGLMYPRYGVLLGPTAENVLSQFHAKTLFLSVAGVNGGILYNQNLLLVQAEQKMMHQAQRIVLLVDAGKFGQQALAKLCDLNQIDTVVADSALDQAHRDEVRSAGCELIVAE